MSEFNRRKQSFSIPNLPLYLIIAYVIGYVIQLTTPELYQFLQFNPYEIFQGQIWRVVTWILVPPESLGIFTIIMLFLYYSLGRELEHTWGSERFTKYIFSGIIYSNSRTYFICSSYSYLWNSHGQYIWSNYWWLCKHILH